MSGPLGHYATNFAASCPKSKIADRNLGGPEDSITHNSFYNLQLLLLSRPIIGARNDAGSVIHRGFNADGVKAGDGSEGLKVIR